MKTDKILIVLSLFLGMFAYACETCELRQPTITKGWTHGTGPESNWDWFIVGIIAAITLLTLFYSVKFLMYPREKDKKHIKNSVLNF